MINYIQQECKLIKLLVLFFKNITMSQETNTNSLFKINS